MKIYKILFVILFVFQFSILFAQITPEQIYNIIKIIELVQSNNNLDSLNYYNINDNLNRNCQVIKIQKIIEYHTKFGQWPKNTKELYSFSDEKLDDCTFNKRDTFITESDTLLYFLKDSTHDLGLQIYLEDKSYRISSLTKKNLYDFDEMDNGIYRKKRNSSKAERIEW